MVRMKDVAKHAGVSVATVSYVISGKQRVSDEARAAVQKSIKDLNYKVNMVARGLKTQRTYTIGVILTDITKLFFNDVIRGIVDEATRAGYKTNLLSSNFDFGTERALVDMLHRNWVDGIILDSCVDMRKSRKWAGELSAAGMPPIVSLENRMDPERLSSVLVDSRYWSGRITQHLIDIGRKRIYFVSGPSQIEHEYNRLDGFISTMKQNGLEIPDGFIFKGDFSTEVTHNAVAKALSKGFKFDAVQASNDQAAIGAVKALLENGIAVPDQVAVCGFDNLFPSTLVSPAITTVDVPRYELGTTAVQELLRRIKSPKVQPTHYILNASIIERASTRAEIVTPWNIERW